MVSRFAIIELKNPADEKATIWRAFDQLQTYKAEIASLMRCNEVLVISDGVAARFAVQSRQQQGMVQGMAHDRWRIHGAGCCISAGNDDPWGVFDPASVPETSITNFVAFRA
jgi:type I site-specific restriction-modification system R (restriction) subunit